VGEQPTTGNPHGEGTEPPVETEFSDTVRERLVRRLAAELGAAWNRALAAGTDSRRLIGRVDAARRRIRSAPPGRAPARRPRADPGHADRQLTDKLRSNPHSG